MVTLLDSSIIIDHLRQTSAGSRLKLFLKHTPYSDVCLSLISVQELYTGKSTYNPQKEKDLLTTIALFDIIPYTYEVAALAGTITRDLARPVTFADAAIAATAIIHHIPLLTLNRRDFLDIPHLILAEMEEHNPAIAK